MKHFKERLGKAAEALRSAENILIGGGSGLSSAAGLTYSGERFKEKFADFIEKYGFEDMYTASFHPFGTSEELWAHWARHIFVNRFEPAATELYKDILKLVSAKPYFVVTTNVESQFEKAGFPKERIFEVQGNYAYLQCAKACHDKLYYNEALVKTMLETTSDCRVPSALVPVCPVCKGPMDVNLRHDDYFLQDAAWFEARDRYDAFLEVIRRKSFICLELGVGFNTPGIIRYPFERLAYRNSQATLIRINRDDPTGPFENEDRTIGFDEDMTQVIKKLISGGDDGRNHQ